MSTKPGRNDPCHCGSGKKYKRCHLPIDQKSKPVAIPESPHLPVPEVATAHLPEAVKAELLRDFLGFLRNDPTPKAKAIVSMTDAIAEYLEKKSEIEAASPVLESHAAEFLKLLEHEKARTELAYQLFSEECFRQLQFSVEDIDRAFNHVGGPPTLSDREATVDKLKRAILYLADKDCRTFYAVKLACQVPNYTKAGKYMEALMIQECAQTIASPAPQVNLFLFAMFTSAYDAWLKSKEKEQPAPRPAAWQLEYEFGLFMERAEAAPLRLTSAEIEPWLPTLLERWKTAGEKNTLVAEKTSPEQLTAMFNSPVGSVVAEMTLAALTPDRIASWLAELTKIKSARAAAGDTEFAACLEAAEESVKNNLRCSTFIPFVGLMSVRHELNRIVTL